LEAAKRNNGNAFWNDLLTDRHEKSAVPQDLAYAKGRVFASQSFSLESNLFDEVIGVENGLNDRLFVAIAAVMTVLIHKFTNSTEVSFGIPNHLNNNDEPLISPVLILKIEIKKEHTVRQLLNIIKNQWLEVKSYGNYPLDVLNPEANDGSGSKLYDIVVSLKNIYPFHSFNTESTNIYFELDQSAEGLKGKLMYNSSAYSLDKAASLVNYFKYLPKVLFAEQDIKIGNLEVILPEEKEDLFKVFNNTQVPIKRNKLFLDFFKEAVQDYPTKIAAKDDISQVCYLDLDHESNQVANFLIRNGLVKGDRVVIIFERSVHFLITLLGVLKSGGVFVALDVDEPISRVLKIMEDAEPRLLFTSKSILSKDDFLKKLALETKIEKLICLDAAQADKEINQTFNRYRTSLTNSNSGDRNNSVLGVGVNRKESKDAVNIKLEGSDLCYLIYSSGTTGTPKGIKLHHLGMINHFVGFSKLLNLTSGDCIAQTALCSFDVFVVQTLVSLVNGGKVLFVSKSNLLQPETFFKIIKNEKIAVIELVPSLIKTMLNEINLTTAQSIDSLRFLISTGEQLNSDLCDMWFSKFREVPIVNAYGPAETSDDVTAFVIEKSNMQKKTAPIGKPLENIHVYVVDQFNQLAPQGVQGEICISGICVGMGYLNDLEKTEKVFVNNPFVEDIDQNKSDFGVMYKTGDLGVWDKKGFLKYVGRKDFMVKIRGVRIELAEIEVIMMTYDSIVSVCVTDILNNNEKVLCAYFEASQEVDVKRFDAYLRKKLPSAMIPTFFMQLDRIPLTRNGKIDRKLLPSSIQTNQTTALNLNNTFEQGLLQIWKEVLKITPDSVGQESDFFFLGGHSLAAIRLVSSIKKKFDVKISLEEVFKFSIFSDLVELIRAANKNEQISIQKAVVKPYYHVSPPQRRFYIHNQIYPSDLSYNSTQYYKIEGELDFNKVQSVLKSLVEHHEILKTSFHLVNNSPVQKIDDSVVFEATYIEDGVENIDQRIKEFVRPFNLNEAPLIRANVIKCSNNSFFLLFDAHHIISDEISDKIIVNDFLERYAGQSVSPPLRQYKDYSEWFNGQIDSGRLMKSEQYWLEQFKTIPPKLSLPYDSFEKVKDEKFGQDIKLSLTNKLSREIREILKNSRTTAFMFFLAVFNAQLKKLTFSDDIAIGSPVSGRENEELNSVVGLFLNLIVLRTQLFDSMSFEELLEDVKKTCINALTHQTYPFDMLTAKLGLQGELDKTPLYSVMFAHLTKGVDRATTADINIETYEVDHNTAKADLQFTIFESEESFEILLTVNTNLFGKETAVKLMNNYNAILELILKDMSVLLKDIPLPTEFDFLNGDTNLKRHELSF
jgi:amino acid adenylation domain-containing protein